MHMPAHAFCVHVLVCNLMCDAYMRNELPMCSRLCSDHQQALNAMSLLQTADTRAALLAVRLATQVRQPSWSYLETIYL